MKTLVVKNALGCPFNYYGDCTNEGPVDRCGIETEPIPADCPLREGLTITVEED
jgi:hypothetical protein